MKERLTSRSVVRKAPGQVSCDMSGEAVVLNMKSGMYYGTDQIGVLVWNLLDEPRAVEDIRNEILREFQVETGRCEEDLISFLNEMESAGLVEVQSGVETEKS